ncbi:MAG TPA: DAK2 domain-containing protein, partial [Ilumatobacteraceae bacterium]|nr:DAK2 domain-containing protein [Ilumatobacteraceae bacterium]
RIVSLAMTTTRLGADEIRRVVAAFRDALRSHQALVNRLNVYPVPDGDTGTNMARTLDAVVAEIDGAPAELGATCDAISHGSLMGARGNSGVILSQVLRGIASTLKDRDALDGAAVADALDAAAAAAYQAVLKPIEGTILTVVRESAEAATIEAAAGASLADVVRAARAAGAESLARTPDLLPVLRDAGVVDAGGAGFLLLLDAAAHVVAGEPLPEPPPDDGGPSGATFEAVARRTSGVDGELDVSEQRYEVMYLCHLADERIGDLKSRWGEIGDSIVVVGGDGIWNCHVHTNDIGAAIESALDLDGRPHRIRVTDLFEEVSAEHAAREAAMTGGGADPELPAVTCAVVAVSSGAGITELFAELGVQAVVGGGQTLNPSTAELLAAVERVNADHVIVLPGNKNIVPVAEQLDALTARTVRVVPTRSMPEGLAALMVYDPEATAEVNTAQMRQAAEAIEAGEVTRAVRASQTPAGPVAEGDWLGIVRGDGIVAVAPDVVGATTALLARLVDDDCELVTVIRGADADDGALAEIEAWVHTNRPGVEIEVHAGGQPLYPFLVGVE